MWCSVLLILNVFTILTATASENEYFQMEKAGDRVPLINAMKDMLKEGFSENEILKALKSELGSKRMTEYIDKILDGGDLTSEETETFKSGQVNELDDQFQNVLGELEQLMEQSINATRRRVRKKEESETSENSYGEEEIVREVFRDNFKGQNEKPNYAYSPYDMMRLVKTEDKLYKPLKAYAEKMEKKLNSVKRYLEDYEKSSLSIGNSGGTFEEKAMKIVSNPLASYKMIRRFAFILPEMWRTFEEDIEEELGRELSSVRIQYQVPNDHDWNEAMDALFRIEYYNGYDAKQFSSGALGSKQTNISLGAEECLELGLRAWHLKLYDFALEWLHLGKIKIRGENNLKLNMKMVDQTIQRVIEQHNKAWDEHTRISVKTHLFREKISNTEAIEVAEKKANTIRKISKPYRSREEYDFPVAYNFVSLCSGETLQTEKERSQLFCWLEHSKDPYFYINPIKIELLSLDPYLIQIYDVIGDKLIHQVKKMTMLNLQRSQVVNYNDPNDDNVSLVRTSSQTWIPQWHPAMGLTSLTKMIEKITGLETRKPGSSEDFQVACYGTSHHYDEHLDAVQDERRTATHGERIATFMLYLSDVEVGGKTAFPVLGVAANPVKGSAVFWYNLRKNGQPDKRTWHGGCPVVHGIKWVMNNWILYNQNFQNRLCSLDSRE